MVYIPVNHHIGQCGKRPARAAACSSAEAADRPGRLPLGEDSLTSLSFDEFYQNWCGELPVHGRGCLWIGKWMFADRR